jgi:hypothetical protein
VNLIDESSFMLAIESHYFSTNRFVGPARSPENAASTIVRGAMGGILRMMYAAYIRGRQDLALQKFCGGNHEFQQKFCRNLFTVDFYLCLVCFLCIQVGTPLKVSGFCCCVEMYTNTLLLFPSKPGMISTLPSQQIHSTKAKHLCHHHCNSSQSISKPQSPPGSPLSP